MQAVEHQGVLLSDPQAIDAALEAHFAEPEHGRPTHFAQLLRSDGTCPSFFGRLRALDLPTLPELALGFQALQHGKAPGVTGIPAEAYSQAPL